MRKLQPLTNIGVGSNRSDEKQPSILVQSGDIREYKKDC